MSFRKLATDGAQIYTDKYKSSQFNSINLFVISLFYLCKSVPHLWLKKKSQPLPAIGSVIKNIQQRAEHLLIGDDDRRVGVVEEPFLAEIGHLGGEVDVVA